MFRRGEAGLEVALGEQRDRLTGAVNTRLPKGKLAQGETPEQAAVREVREETGLWARVVAPLERVSYVYRNGKREVPKEVHFFLMELLEADAGEPDGEFGRVFWCGLDEAAERLSFDTERGVLARARAALEAG